MQLPRARSDDGYVTLLVRVVERGYGDNGAWYACDPWPKFVSHFSRFRGFFDSKGLGRPQRVSMAFSSAGG